jgi:spermidine synthase
MSKRKTYTREFKLQAVRLLQKSDQPATVIASELGVGQSLLYKWRATLTPTLGNKRLLVHQSPHSNIHVTEIDRVRCVSFVSGSKNVRQSGLDLARPERLVLDYTRDMLAGLLIVPNPKQVLVIGLGAGTLPRALQALCAEVHVTTVEIDAAVVWIAERYFSFAGSEQQSIEIADGREWIKRALRAGQRYDMIFLDAFNVDQIPTHMLTCEFLTEARSLLKTGGVVVGNTFSKNTRYDSESVTYAAAFDWMLNVHPPAGNRIVLAGVGEAPDDAALSATAAKLESGNDLKAFDLDLGAILGYVQRQADWNPNAPVLRDEQVTVNQGYLGSDETTPG